MGLSLIFLILDVAEHFVQSQDSRFVVQLFFFGFQLALFELLAEDLVEEVVCFHDLINGSAVVVSTIQEHPLAGLVQRRFASRVVVLDHFVSERWHLVIITLDVPSASFLRPFVVMPQIELTIVVSVGPLSVHLEP